MHNEKNPHGSAIAFRRAKGKIGAIAELLITPNMTLDQQDALATKRAKDKAAKEGTEDWKQFISGQSWYIEDLVKFSGLTTSEKFEHEYMQAFPDIAEEEELLAALESIDTPMEKNATEEVAA